MSSSSNSPLDVLLVDAGTHQVIALSVAHCLAERPEVRLHALSNRKHAALEWSRSRATYIYDDFQTDEGWMAAVERAVADHDVDVIMSASEPGGRFLASHRERLEALATVAPVPALDVLEMAINKGRITAYAADHGLLVPRTVFVTAAGLADGSLHEKLLTLELPVLVKPTNMSAGKGIVRFEQIEALLDNLRSRESIADHELIVQEIIEGTDICCAVICEPGGGVVAHSTFQGLEPAADKFSPWTRMLFHEDRMAAALVGQLTKLLDWHGNANVDFMRTDDGRYYLLEFNGRYDGRILGSMRAGVNFASLHLDMALGRQVSQPPYTEGIYLNLRGTVEEYRARLLRRPHHDVEFSQTALSFAMKDPVPEVMRLLSGWLPGLR